MDTLSLVLRLSNGAAQVPLKKTAFILGLEPQTIRNRLCAGTWRLTPLYFGRNVYFHATDIAELIDRGRYVPTEPTRPTAPSARSRRGTSTAAERQAARAHGLSVTEWRKRAQGEGAAMGMA